MKWGDAYSAPRVDSESELRSFSDSVYRSKGYGGVTVEIERNPDLVQVFVVHADMPLVTHVGWYQRTGSGDEARWRAISRYGTNLTAGWGYIECGLAKSDLFTQPRSQDREHYEQMLQDDLARRRDRARPWVIAGNLLLMLPKLVAVFLAWTIYESGLLSQEGFTGAHFWFYTLITVTAVVWFPFPSQGRPGQRVGWRYEWQEEPIPFRSLPKDGR